MADFQDRKAVITGATRGIGKAIAQAFLEAGATVIGIYGANLRITGCISITATFQMKLLSSSCLKILNSSLIP
jgi:NAD(P)-dependent dehydrogenase (short-subunit alcohol dehydrogenase family)